MRLKFQFGLRQVAFCIALIAVGAAVLDTSHNIRRRSRELQRASVVTHEPIRARRFGIQVHRLPVSIESSVFSVYTPHEVQVVLRLRKDGQLRRVGELPVTPDSRRIHFDVTESGYKIGVVGQHGEKVVEIPVEHTVPNVELPVSHRLDASLPLTLVLYELQGVRYLELVVSSSK